MLGKFLTRGKLEMFQLSPPHFDFKPCNWKQICFFLGLFFSEMGFLYHTNAEIH